MSRRSVVVSAVALLASCGVAACATWAPSPPGWAGPGGGQVGAVAASINAWGAILAQLGGAHVRETSIITNPDTDPHDYEPTPADGRTIASAA
ncbi:MAG: ABC-type metal ion transporter, periplasmic subunit, partial [Pseudonocardia sp.]|nr:ABC-type metal ion transporter, periplasmic subunit [Pseudonocardia sp.]